MLAPLGNNEIVRISTTSGNPVSRVYPGGSCSQYCSQVYAIIASARMSAVARPRHNLAQDGQREAAR
jgi:hypothetical protein